MTAQKTFAIPLAKKRTNFAFKGFLSQEGMSEVAGEYRKRFGGPFFQVERNAKQVPPCDACGAEYVNGKYEKCNGSCFY